ncbi:hypothetical protein F5X68DRAFT_275307 [Plectosphaerella plurivora]|uniref:Transmembrane protein n=1 Tax=Plectosphaerella plurivora TaxID=936078 RepID=A0A9P8VE65_9PEZI|nr:hypothetical protein F5X68DRAFT_275307 [Plectosphaerella plurivora]
MEGKWVQEPLGLRFVEKRPSLTRKFRPRSLQLRQSTAKPPAAEEDLSDSESDSDDELDSPSPTSSSFPAGATAGSSETLPEGASASGITSRPVAQDGIDPANTAQAPTMAIAFGIVGAASVVLCIGVGIWWLCRRSRKKKRASQQPSIASTQPPQVDPRYMQQANLPPDRPDLRRTPSSLMGELMAAAYDVEGGQDQQRYTQTQTPQGYLDEKRYDPNQQLPILQPAPVAQPVVSESIASWVRRHNPLKLNPVNGRTSVYSTAGTVTPHEVSGRSAPPVPAVPPVYQSRNLPGDDDKEFLVPPPLAVPARVVSSNYSNHERSPVSVYARNSGSWFHREYQDQQQQQQQQPQQQNAFNPRAPSMAMTERTESTWASWGGGVSRPQYQPEMPAETQQKTWIEKCVRLGGLR